MIAYFCAEYSLDSRLKTYAGGLGILAGDTVREAGDKGLPFIAIGLYYYKGYLGREYDWSTPESAGLELLKDEQGLPIQISLLIRERSVQARAWVYKYRDAKVYLLDTMLSENHPDDQKISHNLYDSRVEIRLAQEMMLGIGGVKLLKRIGIAPKVYHMNEGHSVFLALEAGPEAHVVFTNHTVVAEANHCYDNNIVTTFLNRYLQTISYPHKKFIELGRCAYPGTFSLTSMAIRVCRMINGVSKLHVQKLNELFPESYAIAITNGIHIPTWAKVLTSVNDKNLVSVSQISNHHLENKKAFLLYLQYVAGVKWYPDALLIGWARRITQYKRPLALFEDVYRLFSILTNSPVAVKIIISGVPHPTDSWANEALNTILSLALERFRNSLVYLPNYNTEVSQFMTSGCDVWLNTPKIGLEACGTSGMKAAVNGLLSLSTADGWMGEVDVDSIGWRLDDEDISQSIYDTLEQKVIPAYKDYVCGADSYGWGNKMLASHKLITSRFSTTRMLDEYQNLMWCTRDEALK